MYENWDSAMYENEFPLDPDVLHLNHAAVGPWPRRAVEAVTAFARQNMHQGSVAYERWLEAEHDLRGQLRTLINARSTDEIALLKSTSEALSVVAHGLDWQDGDNVVISDQEFPSNRIVWESLQPRGVGVHTARLGTFDAPEEALFACVDQRTRLISVSSVQYGTGLRLDLERIGRFCHQHELLFCVDGIQSIGALPMDVQKIHADFVMADGHKWMLGPEGLALFYCRDSVRDRLQLHQYGWHMVEHCGDFDRQDWQVAGSARRFECGSPNMLGVHALRASLSLIGEIGMERVSHELLKNASYLADFILTHEDRFELLSPREPERRAGIVTFRPRNRPAAELYGALRDQGVLCALRGGGVRFSPISIPPGPAWNGRRNC